MRVVLQAMTHTDTMLLITLVCALVTSSTDAFILDKLRCASCTAITRAQDCHTFTSCNPGERCFTELSRSGSRLSFNLGCKAERECLSGASDSSIACLQCCSVDNCNQNLCSVATSSPPTDTQTCASVQDVAIIGAGIAGSYAAWRMRNEGLSVSLYEYSDRIGGRCRTIQFPGIPDVNVELGAMRFIPQEHLLLNKTVHELGLNVIDFPLGVGTYDDTLFYLRGKHLRYNEIAANAPYNIDPDHRKDPDNLQWEIYTNYTDVGSNSAQSKLFVKSLDGIPLYKQSRRTFYAKYFTTDTESYLQDINAFDSDFANVSAAAFVPWANPTLTSTATPNPVKTIASGFQSVPEALVDQFLKASTTHSFHQNHHLRSLVKNQDGNYVLSFQPTITVRGVTKDDMSLPMQQKCAKKVLLAIPRLALEHLDWDVLKQPEILDYIQNSVEEGKGAKIFFAYGDTWWKNVPLASPYAISSTPLRQTYDYGVSPSNGKGVLIPSYHDYYTEIWKDSKLQGNVTPGVGDDSITMTDVGVNIARKLYADVFNISVNVVKQPDYAIMGLWDMYPFGATWYFWKAGYIWEDVENKMTRPSTNDDVFIISNIFSKTQRTEWTEGALEIVENTFAKYFPGI